MLIIENKVYALDHRAYFLKDNKMSSILGVSGTGKITFINLENFSGISLTLGTDIRDISFSDSKKLISFIEDKIGNLTIIDFAGKILYLEKPAPSMTDYSYTNQGFLSCHFDADEKYIWCVKVLTDLTVEIQLRRIDTYSIIDRFILEDPFGDSSFSFYPTTRPNLISLWAAAGQDGQQIYWLETDNEKIICIKDEALADSTSPVFSQNGNEFITLDGRNAIIRYQYPTLKIGRCHWESYEEDKEDFFSESMGYLNENYALVSSNNGLIFLLDVKEMKILEEVIIENHEPMPLSHYYPPLKENNLCTDLSFFECLNNNFIFVYKQGRNPGPKDWKSSLLIIPAEKILAEVSKHFGND